MSINSDFNITNYLEPSKATEINDIEEGKVSAVAEENLAVSAKDDLLSVQPNLTIEGHVSKLLEQLDIKLTLFSQIDALEDESSELDKEVKKTKEEIKKLNLDKINIDSTNILLFQKQERDILFQTSYLKQLKSKLKELEREVEHLQEAVEMYTAAMQAQEQALIETINGETGCNTLELKDLPLPLSQTVSYFQNQKNRLEAIASAKILIVSMLENRKNFLIEKKAFLESQKDFLFQEFGEGQTTHADLKIDLKLLGEDVHHGGASPLLVSFNQDGMVCLKLVYKPRIAETDQAIIDLFKELNQLPESENSLPVYKILNQGAEGSFWHNSLWDYIEGVEPGTSSNANELIQSLKRGTNQEIQRLRQPPIDQTALESELKKMKALEVFEKNLARLQAICQYAGITDLHGENVRLTGIKTDITQKRITELEESGSFTEGKQFQIVPIDLEVVKVGNETGLFGKSGSPQSEVLSSREKEIIDRFLEAQEGRISRFVPIPTAKFVECMWNRESMNDLIDFLWKQLQSLENCDIIIDKTTLFELISNDISRGDIPYFTKQRENIYYGVAAVVIAEIKR